MTEVTDDRTSLTYGASTSLRNVWDRYRGGGHHPPVEASDPWGFDPLLGSPSTTSGTSSTESKPALTFILFASTSAASFNNNEGSSEAHPLYYPAESYPNPDKNHTPTCPRSLKDYIPTG